MIDSRVQISIFVLTEFNDASGQISDFPLQAQFVSKQTSGCRNIFWAGEVELTDVSIEKKLVIEIINITLQLLHFLMNFLFKRTA